MKILSYSGPALLVVFGVASLIGLSSLKKEPPQKAPRQQTALVEVAPISSCESGFKISVDGEVVPYREISLATQVAGRISQKNPQARAGNFIHKGDLLFEVDPRDYELEVKRLQETVKQAASSIEELDVEQTNVEELITLAKQSLLLQQRAVKRFEDLKSRGATSTSQLEDSRQAEIQSLNSLQSLKNQFTLINARRNRLAQEKERATTSLEQALLNLSRATIESPINGLVIQDFAEQDDFVQTGTRLVQLEDTSKVEVRFNLRMDQLQWLWQSKYSGGSTDTSVGSTSQYTYELPKVPVEISVQLDGNRFAWTAHLSRYDGAGINSGTRTVPVIAVVDNPSAVTIDRKGNGSRIASPPTLLRGSFVTIDIPVGSGMSLVSVPATAFQADKTVWLYDDGKLRIQPVKVAYSDQSTVVIQADSDRLAPGRNVITSPLPVAEQGMAVRLPERDTGG